MKGLATRKLLMYGFNTILTIFFVVYLKKGAYGAAVATLIAVAVIDIFIIWPFCRKVAHTSTKIWLEEVVYPCIGSALPSIFLCVIVKVTINVDTWFELLSVSLFSTLLFYIVVGMFGLRLQDRIDIYRISEKAPDPLRNILIFLGKRK